MNTSTAHQIARVNSIMNAAIISFVFDGKEFNKDCLIDGVRIGTPLFNKLSGHTFVPIYNLPHDSYEFVPMEYFTADLPTYLTPQVS